MNLIVKMMDQDNKSFRMVAVGAPVDITVNLSTPTPHLLVNHGVPGFNKTYPLKGNAYIMNEKGETVSKIDAKDFAKEPDKNTKHISVQAIHDQLSADRLDSISSYFSKEMNEVINRRIERMLETYEEIVLIMDTTDLDQQQPTLTFSLGSAPIASYTNARSYEWGTRKDEDHGPLRERLSTAWFSQDPKFTWYRLSVTDKGIKVEVKQNEKPFALNPLESIKYSTHVFGDLPDVYQHAAIEEINKAGNRYPSKVITLARREWLTNNVVYLTIMVDSTFIAEFSTNNVNFNSRQVSIEISREQRTAMINAERSEHCKMEYYNILPDGSGLYYAGTTFEEALNQFKTVAKEDSDNCVDPAFVG